MYLICSAFTEGASPTENFRATYHLLVHVQASRRPAEFCIGTWRGKKELSIKVSGFASHTDLIQTARYLCLEFDQECVMVCHLGVVSLINQDGGVNTVGHGVQCLGGMPTPGRHPGFKADDPYTEFFTGNSFYAMTMQELHEHETFQ